MQATRKFLISESEHPTDETSEQYAPTSTSGAACTTAAGSAASQAPAGPGRQPLAQVVAQCVVHWFNTTLVEAQVPTLFITCHVGTTDLRNTKHLVESHNQACDSSITSGTHLRGRSNVSCDYANAWPH